ncbi:MAG: aldehyde dehydrogenase family protein [Candidatus Acidiferrales bacterium]
MDLRDRDLISIQQARELAVRAAAAQKRFATFSQQQVDAIVEACATAATEAAESLARVAVEETGYGNVPDKILKNRVASVEVPRAIREMRTVGVVREDAKAGIIEIATPIGVVAAIIPSTNPTSTAIYKTLIAIKARNAIVLSPHPSAIRCICQAAAILDRAALTAGAPEGLISCMTQTTLPGTQELMRQREVGVVLATGGTGLVRAAYSSGKPAYGVGPGNVPAAIERTANVHEAVADIIAGKTFDYGTICSSEQAIVAEESVRDQALEELRQQGAHFLSREEAEKVGRLVFQPGSHVANSKIVGRPATVIAEMAGISVPSATRVLIARLEPQQVGREFPLSAEKLSPILAFYAVADFAALVEQATRLLLFGGAGHTASIHTSDADKARRYGQAVPAFRVCVNTSSVHGSIGYSTNLFPAMTLGCGAPGGNITSDNIGPQHLMNIKRIAWESRPVEHRTVAADRRMFADAGIAQPIGVGPSHAHNDFAQSKASSAPPTASSSPSGPTSAPALSATAKLDSPSPALPDRAVLARLVEHVLSAHGIARGSGLSGAAAADTRAETPPAKSTASAPPQIERDAPKPVAASPSPKPAKRSVEISAFVSENDVRQAMTRSQKIFIGPKTILTPSARDLGREHEVFVETGAEAGVAP